MPDYEKIKAEYISDSSATLRNLAEKHAVSPSQLMKISAREKWADLRKQADRKAEAKLVQNAARRKEKRLVRVTDVADLLLNEIETRIHNGEIDMTAQSIKQLTGALKDIKDIKDIRSERDIREQEARIKKLIRDAEGEHSDREIVIRLGDGLEDYCG